MSPRPDIEQLARDYHRECLKAIAGSQALGYNPTGWTEMIERHGAVEAAKRLVVSGDLQSGFTRLIDLHQPQLTIEWSVACVQKWAPLFDERDHREPARWRLDQAGVKCRE